MGPTQKKITDAKNLRQQLIAVTIGGSDGAINQAKQQTTLTRYVQSAFPIALVRKVTPLFTAAALNSISGILRLKFPDRIEQDFFGKIHVESNTNTISALGAEEEYSNAQTLADAGWPVLQPLRKSVLPDYPLLLYPLIKESTVFELLEASHQNGTSLFTQEHIDRLEQYHKRVGEKELQTMRKGTHQEAIDAPVQTLFLQRMKPGGRIDQWYSDDTLFSLPGIDQPLSWKELSTICWNINGKRYGITLDDIVHQSRQSFAYTNEKEAFLIISHGDDHAGNVRLTDPVIVFDPAFAGWNPATLELKALAHTGFLPMAALYYLPKGLTCTYTRTGNTIYVEHTMKKLPLYATHEIFARQIIDYRLIPLLRTIKDQGGDMIKETQRIQNGLAACALLTVNIAKLLQSEDGRGAGLLPMAIMFQELRGLPLLDYLAEKILTI